jgi:hypothetical protein
MSLVSNNVQRSLDSLGVSFSTEEMKPGCAVTGRRRGEVCVAQPARTRHQSKHCGERWRPSRRRRRLADPPLPTQARDSGESRRRRSSSALWVARRGPRAGRLEDRAQAAGLDCATGQDAMKAHTHRDGRDADRLSGSAFITKLAGSVGKR